MKIAASDFDGTLFVDNAIAESDLASIVEWRAAGNKFGIVTGRNYSMLTPPLTRFKPELDYLICSNGAAICRADGTPVWQTGISLPLIEELIRNAKVARSRHYVFSAIDSVYYCHEREGSWINFEQTKWDMKFTEIAEEDINKLPQVQQFSLDYATSEEAQDVSAELNRLYGGRICAYPNQGSIDINPVGISKRQGIEKLCEVMDWQAEKILTIGDEFNDLPMIEAFDGYTVTSAKDEIKAKAKRIVPRVGAMLAENM